MLAGLAVALFAVLAAPAARAAEPLTGIVIAVTGLTSPALPEMTEIPARTQVTVDPGVSLTFLLYSKCTLVTVTAGTLKFSDSDFTTTGEVVSRENSECPGRFELREPAVGAGEIPGGVNFRGVIAGGRELRLKPNAQIVFAGAKGAQVTAAALAPEGKPDEPLLRYHVASRRGVPPYGLPIPAPGKRYTLRLILGDRPAPVDVPVTGSAGGAGFVVVRVD